eukprot:Pgem_evm1s13262
MYVFIIQYASDIGSTAILKKYLTELQTFAPSSITTSLFNGILGSFVNTGKGQVKNNDKMLDVYRLMLESGVDFNLQTYDILMLLCLANGEAEQVPIFFAEMQKAAIEPENRVFHK